MGHGDHWRAVLGETGGTVQLVRKMLEKGASVPVTEQQKTYYDSHPQKTAFSVEEYLSDLPIGVRVLGLSIAYSGLEMTVYGNYGQEPEIPAFLISRDEVEINVWVRTYIDGQEPAVSFSEEEVNNYLESSAKRNQKGACVVVVCKDIGSGYTFKVEGMEKLKDLTGEILMIHYKRKENKDEDDATSDDTP